MGLSFKGNFSQKVDSKGRMSIPAEFRRVLEDRDPDFPANPNPGIVILYGPHILKEGCLHAYSVEAMREIEADIEKLPRGSKKQKYLRKLVLSCAWESEIDRDGRIVLPKDRREDIGLTGEARMVAMGSYFEIWNAGDFTGHQETYEDFVDEFGEDMDPLALLDEE